MSTDTKCHHGIYKGPFGCGLCEGERKVALTKPRRLTKKQVDKIIADYNLPARVEEYLATLGELVWRKPADLERVPWEVQINPGGARLRDVVILTEIGPLGVSVYDDWIPCVFDDAWLGRARIGASYPSGKWNHHAFVNYYHKPTDRTAMLRELRDLVFRFITQVESITLHRPLMEVCAEIELARGSVQ